VLALLVGARVARPVLVPVLLAAIVCLLANERIARRQRRGVAAVLDAAAIALLPLALLALFVFGGLLLGGFAPHASREFDAARIVFAGVLDRASLHVDLGRAAAWLQAVDGASVRSFFERALADGALVLAEAGVLAFFGLLSLPPVARRVGRLLPPRRCRRLRLLARDLKHGLVGCLGVMLAVNAGLAAALALSLAVLGIAQPLAWAGVVFVLLFVPYLGPLAAAGLLLVAGAARSGAAPAMAAPALVFVCLHGIEANLISPWLTARRLQTNRVAVLLAVLAGTWAWGVIGGLLALPLLLGARLALAHAGQWPVLDALLACEDSVDASAAASGRDGHALPHPDAGDLPGQLAIEDLGPPDLHDTQPGGAPARRIERVAPVVDRAHAERRGDARRRAG